MTLASLRKEWEKTLVPQCEIDRVFQHIAWMGSTLIPRITGARVQMFVSNHDARHGTHQVFETDVANLNDYQLWIARQNTWELGSFDIELPANNSTTEVLCGWLERHPKNMNQCRDLDPESLEKRLQNPADECCEWWDAHAFTRGPMKNQPRVQWNNVHQFIADFYD